MKTKKTVFEERLFTRSIVFGKFPVCGSGCVVTSEGIIAFDVMNGCDFNTVEVAFTYIAGRRLYTKVITVYDCEVNGISDRTFIRMATQALRDLRSRIYLSEG